VVVVCRLVPVPEVDVPVVVPVVPSDALRPVPVPMVLLLSVRVPVVELWMFPDEFEFEPDCRDMCDLACVVLLWLFDFLVDVLSVCADAAANANMATALKIKAFIMKNFKVIRQMSGHFTRRFYRIPVGSFRIFT